MKSRSFAPLTPLTTDVVDGAPSARVLRMTLWWNDEPQWTTEDDGTAWRSLSPCTFALEFAVEFGFGLAQFAGEALEGLFFVDAGF